MDVSSVPPDPRLSIIITQAVLLPDDRAKRGAGAGALGHVGVDVGVDGVVDDVGGAEGRGARVSLIARVSFSANPDGSRNSARGAGGADRAEARGEGAAGAGGMGMGMGVGGTDGGGRLVVVTNSSLTSFAVLEVPWAATVVPGGLGLDVRQRCVCVCVCIYIYVRVYECIYMSVCICLYVFVYMYVYV